MQYLLWPLSEQFQNKNGSILTNGKVYVYYRGRTALATTWSDEDGTVENPQPIILDDNGRAACYVNPAYYYTVVVCDFYGKELFSYDISLHDGVGTGDNNIEITSSDHSILIDKSSIIDGYRYDEKVNPEFVAEIAVSAVSDLIPHYWNNDRTVVIDDSSKEIKTDMQCVMIRQQINNSSTEYKYAKICEADINTITWINEWMTTLQLSFQSNGAYYSGKSSGIFVLNCENYLTQSGYSQRHEEDGKWLLFDKDNSSPQISKLYLYWRDDFSSQHYELWGEFNNLKYYEGVGVAALINCSLRNHLTSSLPIDQERNIWRFNPIGIETLKDALPTDAGSLVKTFDPADADIKPIAEPDPGTFYATYVYNGPASGNTSFDDIKAAYDAGKSVYVNYKENTDSKDTEVYSLVLFRDTPIGRPDLSCFYFTNMRTGTNKTIYRFPSNWGKMSDQNFASSDSVWDLQHAIATDYQLLPIPSPSGTYAVYGYHLYKSKEEITEETWFDPTQWQEITVMDEVQSLIASSSGTTDVFIANYMDTPVSSVFEAVDEGKFVWVSLVSDGHGPYLPMNVTSTEVGGTKTNYVKFVGLYDYSSIYEEGKQVLVTAANPTGWEGVTTTNEASKDFVLSTVSGASSILETEIQTVSSAIEGISGQNGVFIAEYGTTTFEEIGEAVTDGKAVFGKGHPYNSDMLLPIASFTSPRPSIAIFSGIVGNYQYSIKLDGTTWSNDTIILAKNEDVVNADWEAASGKAEILNKPEIVPVSGGTGIIIEEVSGVTLISTSGAGTEDVFWALYGTTPIDQIAAARSAGKIVKITRGSGADIFYGDLTDYAFGTYYFTLFNRNGQAVYTASVVPDGSAGTWSWSAKIIPEAQVNADWEATSGAAEILNKPTISGGTGIEVQNYSGTILISSTGPNYEAGQYISIVNDQISATGLVDQSTYNTDTVKYESAYSTVESNSAIWNETQVNADWEATSGVAEILNKPTLTPVSGGTGIEIVKTDGKIVISATGSTVPASGVFFAEYGVTTTQEILDALSEGKEVIAYTTDVDDGIIYSYLDHTRPRISFCRSYPSFSRWWYNIGDTWSSETLYYNPPVSGGIETIQQDNRYYLQAKVDGTTISINSSGQLESIAESLPDYSVSDAGKVLTVDSQGEVAWAGSIDNWDEAYDIVNASAQIWNEAAAMDEYPISAGPGIKIEDVDDVTVFSTSGVMMEADLAYNGQGEISGYNGSPIMTVDSEKQWLTHDDTIAHVTNSAQYAFGVNVPVVAQAMGTDETKLFSNSSNVSACTLSEDIQNFNRFKIGVRTNSGEELFEFTTGSNGTSYDIITGKGNNQGVISICQFTISGTSITAVRSEGIVFSWGSNPSYRHNEDMSFIQNVYGVGRKENT